MKVASLALALCFGIPGIALAETQSQPTPAPLCFQPSQIRSTAPISDREILFYMYGGKVWKNTLRADCPGLKFENAFSYEVRGDAVCANSQMIRVLRRGTACMLGEFTAYTPPKPSD